MFLAAGIVWGFLIELHVQIGAVNYITQYLCITKAWCVRGGV